MGDPLIAAVDALDRGGAVVFPTETVWGIGARIDRPAGVRRIFAAKGRSPDKVLQVLVPDAEAGAEIAELTADAVRLTEAFMPGPLTLVLRSRAELPAGVGDGRTVGVRVPDHPTALGLLRAAGPLAASSANRTGEPTPRDLDGVRELFGSDVDAYVDGPSPTADVASTVVDLTGAEPVVRRAGALAVGELERVLGRSVRLAST